MKSESLSYKIENTSILKLLIELSVPAAAAQLISALYSAIDRIYISRIPSVGTDALAGLGICFPLIMLVTAFAMLISNGSSALATIKLGEKNYKDASDIMGGSFILLIVVGIITTVVFKIFMQPFLIFFGGDEVILPYGLQYMNIYIIGTVFVLISLGMNCFINSQGYTKVGMLSVAIGALANIILDPIFIFKLKMGIKGAAIATVISQGLSVVFILIFLFSKTPILKLSLKSMVFRPNLMFQGCMLGLSAFIFQINESIVVIFLNRLLLSYAPLGLGNMHLAVLSIVSTLQQFFFMPLKGIVLGSQPIVSYCVGARNYPVIHKTVSLSRAISMACATLMWFVLVFFSKDIAAIFTPDTELCEMASRAIRLSFSTIFVLGMQMINQNTFIALGNIKYSFIFGLMRKVILLIPIALVLPRFFGVWSIYGAEAVSNVLTTIITYFVFEKYMKKLKIKFCQ